MKIGCIGMTTLDTLLFTDRLPIENEDLGRLQVVYECLGGKGLVPALSAFSLGCDVSLLTLIGNKPEVRRFLPRGFAETYMLGVLESNNRTWIPISTNQRSCTLFVYSSPLRQDARPKVIRSIHRFLKTVNLLYLSTEYMFVVREASTTASRLGLPLVTNLNAALMSDPECLAGDVTDLLVPFSHTLILNERESDQALRRLNLHMWSETSSPRLQEVIITRGERGGIVASRPFEDWHTYRAHASGVSVCAVGAGDTFNGGYIKARFIDGKSPFDSCTYAATLAGQKVSVPSSSLYKGVRVV
jgi:sugar/nucleoside kinase (ribokinase family)